MQINEIIKRKASLQEDRYNKSLYIPKIIYENKPLITEQNQKILSKNFGIIDKIEGKNLGLKNSRNIKTKIEKIFHKPHSKTLSMYEKIRTYDLIEKKPLIVDFFAMEFVYLEVSVKNKQNPLKLELIPTYHEKLKVYCSSVNKFPSKFNSEQVFESRTLKIYSQNKKKHFEISNYYFAVFSELSQEITFKLYFGEHEINQYRSESGSKPIKQKNEQTNKIELKLDEELFKEISKNKTKIYLKKIELIKKKRYLKMLEISKNYTSKIIFNKSQINFASPTSIRFLRSEQKLKLDNKLHNANNKKLVIDSLKLNETKLKLAKHEINKVFSDFLREKEEKKKKLKIWKIRWILIINQIIFYKEFTQFAKKKYDELKKIRFLAFKLETFKIKYKKFMKKKGTCVEMRFLLETKQGLVFNMMKGRKKLKHRCELIFKNILTMNSENYDINCKINKFWDKVTFIQKNFREFRLKIKYFKIISQKLWIKYFPMIAANIVAKTTVINDQKELRKIQNSFTRINDNATRLYFIEKFFKQRMNTFKYELHKHLEITKNITNNDTKDKKKTLRFTRMFVHEKDNLLEKETHKRRLSVFEAKFKSNDKNELESIENDSDEEDLQLNFESLRDKKIDALKMPRLFILPNFETLKILIQEAMERVNNLQLKKSFIT